VIEQRAAAGRVTRRQAVTPREVERSRAVAQREAPGDGVGAGLGAGEQLRDLMVEAGVGEIAQRERLAVVERRQLAGGLEIARGLRRRGAGQLRFVDAVAAVPLAQRQPGGKKAPRAPVAG
jgi:hypothetical protein